MIKFGTGGFRGIIGDTFTPATTFDIAHAIVSYMDELNLKKEVAISYDFRDQSPETAKQMADVLAQHRIKVYLSQVATPTPVLMYAVKKQNLDFGIMITASHNPANYNGVKVFEKGGVDASVSTTTKLEYYLNLKKKPNQNQVPLEITYVDFLTPYFDFIKQFIHINHKTSMKFLFDAIYGTGLVTIPPLAKMYGLTQFSTINDQHDILFGGKLPNPTYENMIADKAIQQKEKYDLVLGTDSDADRLGLLDENGRYVDNNEILAAIYYYLVVYKKHTGDIVKNIATSNLIDKVAHKLGYQCHIVDVGFKNISSKMLETNALIGGESSGGLTIRNYIMGKDSTLSALLIIEMVTNLQKTLSKIIDEVRSFAEFKLHTYDYEIHFKNREEVIEKIHNNLLPKDQFLTLEVMNNNYKYHLNQDEWLLLRFSGTEPLMRVICETKEIERARQFFNYIEERING